MAADRVVKVVLQGNAQSLVDAANAGKNALLGMSRVDTSGMGKNLKDAGTAADGYTKSVKGASTAADEHGKATQRSATALQNSAKATQGSASAFDKLKTSMTGQIAVGGLVAGGVMAAFGAVKNAIGDVVNAGVTYQTTMFTLQAVTHSNAATMADVSVKARQLGKDITLPGTSATDAAMAMTELAKGGLTVSQAMTAAKGSLQLAAAAGVDAASAAEIQVNVLNSYHLAADQAGRVADVLANAANQASGEMTDFSEGLKMVGSTAHGLDISLEDTTTVLGLFANAGVKGEMGGTLLNTMLVRMESASGPAKKALDTLGVTVFDSSGKFEGLAALTDQLRHAHETLTPAAYNSAAAIAFGSRGIRGVSILGAEAADAYGKMGDALGHAGGAAELANAKMQGLGGAFQNLENQVQDAQLAIFDKVSPALTAMTNAFAVAVPAILDTAMTAIGSVASKVGDLLAPVVDGIKQLFSSANTGEAMNILGTALKDIGVGALGALGALQPLFTLLGDAVGWISGLPGPIQAIGLALGGLVLFRGPIGGLLTSLQSGFQAIGPMFTATATEIELAGGLLDVSMTAVATTAKAMWAALGGWVGIGIAAITTAFTIFASSGGDATVQTTDFTDAIDANTGALVKNASAVISKHLEDSGSLQAYSAIGGAVQDYTSALTGNAKANDDVHTAIQKAGEAAAVSSGAYQRYRQASQSNKLTLGEFTTQLLASKDTLYGNSAAMQAVIAANAHFAADAGGVKSAQDGVNLTLKATGDAAADAAPKLDGLVTSQTLANQSADDGSDAYGAMKAALKEYKSAAEDATTAGDFLWQSMEEISGKQIGMEDATRTAEAAIRSMAGSARDLAAANADVTTKQDALTAATNKYGADSPQAAAAARDLADANDKVATAGDKQTTSLEDAAKAILTQAGAAFQGAGGQSNLTVATDAAKVATQKGRDEFIKAAEQMGYNTTQANSLADQYHLIPDQVKTQFVQAGMDAAQLSADALKAKLKSIDGMEIHYAVVGGTVEVTNKATIGNRVAKADGGFISGPGGPRDDKIPALLSNGEFVVTAERYKQHKSTIDAIHAGRFANGGAVTWDLISKFLSQATSAFDVKANPVSSFAGSGNVGTNPNTSGTEQWRGIVDQALAILGQPTAYDNIVLNQMRTESSGNPNAINLTDINAQRGIPSKGLVQVIDPTFRSYAVPPYNQNIWDPLSNVLAGINYAIHRYGSVPAGMRGVAYASGGQVPGDSPGYDSVPAMLSPGEIVLSRMAGYKDKNKALLDEAAGWFGGSVSYGALPPSIPSQGGGPVVHNHYNNGPSGGIHVGEIVNTSAGDMVAELDYARARMGV